MSAKNFTKDQFTMERQVCTLFARATGAGTSALTGVKGKGITSITRSNPGVFSLLLDSKFNGLLMFVGNVIDTGTVDDWEVIPTSDLTSGNTITFQVFKGGAAADLPATAKLLLQITLSNTAQLPTGY